MDFTFTEQQIEFHDAIRRFLVVEAAPELMREFWETPSGRSGEMRAKLAEQGLTALSVPEEHGGLGLSDTDWVLILQELGYYGIPDSLVDVAYLASGILRDLPASASAFAEEWLPRIASGDARIAIDHPINPLVGDAEVADLILLWHDDEVHAITPDQAKLRLNESIDRSRRLYHIDWTPTEATRICDATVGAPLWAELINRATLAGAAQLLGLAERMQDLGVDYASQRKQFGKPVGAFQAVKHHMADVAVQIQFVGPTVHRVAYALETGHPRRAVLASQAKIAASEAAQLAARNSLQVHGAIGYTWEADLQMFMKRAWALAGSWGDSAFHKNRCGNYIFSDDALLGAGATFTEAVGS